MHATGLAAGKLQKIVTKYQNLKFGNPRQTESSCDPAADAVGAEGLQFPASVVAAGAAAAVAAGMAERCLGRLANLPVRR